MKQEEFEKRIHKNKYHVFVFSSPAMIPVNFIAHIWFVTVSEGKVSRWEVLHKKSLVQTSWNYLHLNAFKPTEGMFKSIFLKEKWESTLLYSTEGSENSIAHKIIDLINKSPKNYPFCNTYSLLGPNSNTFAQWILDNVPEYKITLPANALGKNYRHILLKNKT